MTSLRVTMLLALVLVSGIASTQAQLQEALAVAGESLNKAVTAAQTQQSSVPKDFQKRPKSINSYAQYLKYAGQAQGILPVEPEADSPGTAPGPSADDSALAPASAMAATGQPSFETSSNSNPTIQDWVSAYQPVDKALNKAFETRITNSNARQVQYNLAVAAAPLQVLINDQVIKQGDDARSFASNVLSGNIFGGLMGGRKSASSITANPLTGTAVTAPTAEAPAPTAVEGSTVTVANPAASSAPASAPAAGATAAAPVTSVAVAPAMASNGTPTVASASSSLASPAARNPLASLFTLPSFGKRKLLTN